MKSPLVTIITPTFNHPERLVECIASAQAQIVSDWEQVVVDDGSDVPAADIVATLADPRIRVITRAHSGILRLAEAYNAALHEACGEFVAILEDDDLWPTNKLALQLQAFSDRAVILCWGKAQLIDGAGTALGILPNEKEDIDARVLDNTPPGGILSELLTRNILPACTVVVRKASLEAVGGFSGLGLPYVDYPTWLRLAPVGRFHFCPHVCGVWRIHFTQTSATRAVEQQETAARLALEYFDALPPPLRSMVGFSRAGLITSGKDRVAQGHLWRGRFRAAAGERKEAREDFAAAARGGGLRTRLKALTALVGLSLGLDLERLARMTGRLAIRAAGD